MKNRFPKQLRIVNFETRLIHKQVNYVNRPVKSMTYLEDGIILEETASQYDDNGKLTYKEKKFSNQNYLIEHHSEFTSKKYDDKGNVTEEKISTNANTVGKTTTYNYKYDQKGNMKESIEHSDNQYKMSKYDGNGNKTELTIDRIGFGEDDEIQALNRNQKIIYRYDEKGNQTETKNGGNTTLFVYDEKGNCTEQNYYDGALNLVHKYTYMYDDKGNVTEENYCEEDHKLVHKYTFKYDAKGNVTEYNFYNEDGELDYMSTFNYDEIGDLIEESTYGAEGCYLEGNRIFKYEYDKYGNWIKMTILVNNVLKTIGERVIEYY